VIESSEESNKDEDVNESPASNEDILSEGHVGDIFGVQKI
jgi:hypothetical protein